MDINLGQHIDLLRPFGIKIAVITNASLLWMDDVKTDMIDRILQGVLDFAKQFRGTLVTETMLVNGLNDDKESVKEIANCIKGINPEKAYLLVPTRPPAEKDVYKPAEESLRNAYDIFHQSGMQVECITGDEDDSFYFTNDVVSDLLSISAVHPVREDVIINLLKKRNLDWSMIDQLIDKKLISSYTYEGKTFFKRNI